MCGICGIWDTRICADMAGEQLRRMADSMSTRGPDDQGVWFDRNCGVGFGHRRLAIVDLSQQGHQPMASADGRYVISYNGEIYNAPQLAQALRSDGGFEPRGHSDTEVLLEGVSRWGLINTLKRVLGMFAFALWDSKERQLHLVRDALGIKPIYYASTSSGVLLFGSCLAPLKVHPAFHRSIDPRALAGYIRHGVVSGSRSIYHGVRKLQPGALVTFSSANERPEPQHFWSASVAISHGRANRFRGSFEEAVDTLDQLLKDAVSSQMLSDVPVGLLLSGGIDSSVVAAVAQTFSNRPVRTFSVGFANADYDEAPHAHVVARTLGTEHTELYMSSDDALAVIPKLPTIYDEPFADSSQIPTYLVSQLARQHVTVVLSGDGGDELFGGYNRHVWAPRVWDAANRVPVGLRKLIARALTVASPSAYDSLYRSVVRALPVGFRVALPGDKVHKAALAFAATSAEDLYTRLVSQWYQPNSIFQSATGEASPWNTELPDGLGLTEKMMLWDLVGYLPDDILTKVDRASMAVSLEARVPLLDQRVAEFAWSLPLEYKIREGRTKAVLRRVLERYVPAVVTERPKAGFGLPIADWLRGPLRSWASSLLDSRRIQREGILRPEPIERLWRAHLGGRVNAQHSLWVVLMFESWLDCQGLVPPIADVAD